MSIVERRASERLTIAAGLDDEADIVPSAVSNDR